MFSGKRRTAAGKPPEPDPYFGALSHPIRWIVALSPKILRN